MSKLIILFLLSICFISCNYKSSADIKREQEDSLWLALSKDFARIQYNAMKNQQAYDLTNYYINNLKCCSCCKCCKSKKKPDNDKSK